MAKNISRKDFLKGAAMSAAGVGLFASGLMNAAAEEEKPEYKNSSNWVLASQNVKWERNTTSSSPVTAWRARRRISRPWKSIRMWTL